MRAMSIAIVLLINVGMILITVEYARADDSAGPASSQALEESAEAVAAMTEAGVKVTSGVVALPVSAAGLGSAAVGSVAETAGALSGAVGEETLEAGSAAWDFANEPLSIDDDVIVAQPAPAVPFAPDAQRED